MSSSGSSLLLNVGTQTQNVLLAGHLELIGEAEILHLDLKVEHRTETSGFTYSHSLWGAPGVYCWTLFLPVLAEQFSIQIFQTGPG